nr:hypothetical protein [Tanacetum cinerariifolium]
MRREEGDERAPELQALIVAGFKNDYQVIIFLLAFIIKATEPFEEPLILSTEDRVGLNKDDVLEIRYGMWIE